MTTGNDAVSGDVTQAMRDYLGAIDRLGDGQSPASTQRIALQLGVSCPSVTNMIKRLHNRGLVSYEPYHGVCLTETGKSIVVVASQRRHLLERYLAERLGYAFDEAQVEATRLEGAVTGAMEAHIEAALNAALAAGSGTPGLPPIFGTEDAPSSLPTSSSDFRGVQADDAVDDAEFAAGGAASRGKRGTYSVVRRRMLR